MNDFSGRCKNYSIAKYLSYAVYACAYWNNKKNTVPLGKTMIVASFHLLDVIYHFSASKRWRERDECKSCVAVLELYDEWRQE